MKDGRRKQKKSRGWFISRPGHTRVNGERKELAGKGSENNNIIIIIIIIIITILIILDTAWLPRLESVETC